jgi:hypothetical protein
MLKSLADVSGYAELTGASLVPTGHFREGLAEIDGGRLKLT